MCIGYLLQSSVLLSLQLSIWGSLTFTAGSTNHFSFALWLSHDATLDTGSDWSLTYSVPAGLAELAGDYSAGEDQDVIIRLQDPDTLVGGYGSWTEMNAVHVYQLFSQMFVNTIRNKEGVEVKKCFLWSACPKKFSQLAWYFFAHINFPKVFRF